MQQGAGQTRLGTRSRVVLAVGAALVVGGGVAAAVTAGGGGTPSAGPQGSQPSGSTTATATAGADATTQSPTVSNSGHAADSAGPASTGAATGAAGGGAAAAVVKALCPVNTSSVEALLGVGGTSDLESLRDALPLLHERIDTVAAAGEGGADVAARLQSIESHWRDALSAHDLGHPKAARDALAAANREVRSLDADLAAAGVRDDDCR